MSRSLLTRIEEGYLKLFRIAIIIILTLVLLATIALAVDGVRKMTAKPVEIAPATPADALPAKPDTSLDDKVSAQIARLFGYFDGYQRACRIAPDVRVD